MDVYKLKPGASKVYVIDRSLPTVMGRKPPHFVQGEDKKRIFAVCPGCDGPIQIVGFFKNTLEGGKKPYGKHVTHSIPDIALYDEDDYYSCPYANRFWQSSSFRSVPKDSEKAKKIKQFVLEQFDRIIYVLQLDTDMRFSKAAIAHLLNTYVADRAWDYRNTRAHNIPWVMAESEDARHLIGQKVLKGSPLHEALKGVANIDFVEDANDTAYVRVTRKGNKYLNASYFFPEHYFKKSKDGEHVDEFLRFAVYTGQPPKHTIVYEKVIKVDINRFIELCNKTTGTRQQWILDIAKDIIKIK